MYGLIANFKPGHQETWVDYDQDRAPLLFIAGEKDHIMPPSVKRMRRTGESRIPRSAYPIPITALAPIAVSPARRLNLAT